MIYALIPKPNFILTLISGLNLKMPWLHKPIIYDIRATPRRITSPTGSKDLQTVNISLRVLSRPDPNKLQTICRRLGSDYDDRLLYFFRDWLNLSRKIIQFSLQGGIVVCFSSCFPFLYSNTRISISPLAGIYE